MKRRMSTPKMLSLPEPVEELKNPEQPIGLDALGCMRFKPNTIVRWLIDEAIAGRARTLNYIVTRGSPGFSTDDLTQFWQLLGYSVSGIGELDFIDKEKVARWDATEAAYMKAQRANGAAK